MDGNLLIAKFVNVLREQYLNNAMGYIVYKCQIKKLVQYYMAQTNTAFLYLSHKSRFDTIRYKATLNTRYYINKLQHNLNARRRDRRMAM